MEKLNTSVSNSDEAAVASQSVAAIATPVTLIKQDLFRFFFRKHYKDMAASNDELDYIGNGFNKYLANLPQHIKDLIIPKREIDVILNGDHPLLSNGFHPALVIHFTQFVEQQKRAYEQMPLDPEDEPSVATEDAQRTEP